MKFAKCPVLLLNSLFRGLQMMMMTILHTPPLPYLLLLYCLWFICLQTQILRQQSFPQSQIICQDLLSQREESVLVILDTRVASQLTFSSHIIFSQAKKQPLRHPLHSCLKQQEWVREEVDQCPLIITNNRQSLDTQPLDVQTQR